MGWPLKDKGTALTKRVIYITLSCLVGTELVSSAKVGTCKGTIYVITFLCHWNLTIYIRNGTFDSTGEVG